ncbi:MAG: glycosyltransferase [Proteobacteria bacterium]|nr:glycosyltransferase [Pseudomonadota bacterium]
MKIALIHEHLAQDGGAEKVLAAFQEIWPDAPTYVLVHNKKKSNPSFHDKDIRTSFIQKIPFSATKYKWLLPLMPTAVESYDLTEYDVILSSNTAFAKGVITLPTTMHICYCHTPTRYLWSDTHSYIKELGYSSVVKRTLPYFLSNIRMWDRMAAERVDRYIANSELVQNRITKYYKQDSDLIYPPVDAEKFYISKPKEYFLAGGRLVPYKRFDLIIDAFNRLGRPLKVYGDGPEFKALKEKAKSNIEFLGRVSDEDRAKLYSEAQAFINPQEEDFGITVIEAQASGRPVIAYRRGGALETVKEGETGMFFDNQTWEDLADVIVRFKSEDFDPQMIRAHALTFDKEAFKKQMKDYVENKWENFNSSTSSEKFK